MNGLKAMLALIPALSVLAVSAGKIEHRYVYLRFDYTADEHLALTSNLVATAKAHGYTDVMFSSTVGLGEIFQWDERRLERLKAAKRLCDETGLGIAVGMWSIGYAKEALFKVDPNLAAAQPVFDTVYRVKNGACAHMAEPARELISKPMEVHAPARENDVGERLLAVKPHRSYRLKIVASSSSGEHETWPILVTVRRKAAKSDYVEHRVFKLKTDGEKRTFLVNFPSMAENELRIRCAGYNRRYTGSATIHSMELSETEPQPVIRRHGTPITVRNRRTGAVLSEGTDYAPIPKAKGVWPGAWVKDKFRVKPLAGGAIKEGDEITVDCYASFPVWGRWVSACMAAEELPSIIERSAAKVAEILKPKVWLLSFDEVRSGGGCEDCRREGDMAHVYAGLCVKAMRIVRRHCPDAEFYLWNDLVDPFAQPDEGLSTQLYSSLKGVWDLLPKDLGIAYWTYQWKEDGLKFFARQGRNILIGAYYDERELKRSLEWMELARTMPGVTGIMYCTWRNKWELLGEFGDEAAK